MEVQSLAVVSFVRLSKLSRVNACQVAVFIAACFAVELVMIHGLRRINGLYCDVAQLEQPDECAQV
ncbi:hypothetical protein PC123_g9349 [Phytophthora cactorum]|nr:hypothetical protein PC120_g13047 [Phytophthora cactorum]KAG4055566.1 hypothetical protein PC123_g9349 [Phytophthora cactorum]